MRGVSELVLYDLTNSLKDNGDELFDDPKSLRGLFLNQERFALRNPSYLSIFFFHHPANNIFLIRKGINNSDFRFEVQDSDGCFSTEQKSWIGVRKCSLAL